MKKLLIAIVFFVGCSKADDNALSVTNLEYEKLEKVNFTKLSELLIQYPLSMFVTDSLIVVQEYDATESFFYTFDRLSGIKVGSFLKKGNSGQEALNISNNYLLEDNQLSLYDDAKKQLITYSICDNDFVFQGTESTLAKNTDNSVWIKNYFKLNDSISFALGCNGVFDQNLLLIFADEQSVPSCANPDLSKYLSDEDKLTDVLFGPSFFKINTHVKKAVFGTYKGGLFQIFDLSTLPGGIVLDTTSLFCAPYDGSLQDRKIRYGFEDIFVTDNYIYALYNGKKSDENEYFAQEILIFDWSGECKFKLESDLYLRSLCVDEDQNELFAAAYDNEIGFYLVKTKLPF